MFELIKSVALKMLDEKTPEQNLIYVVALVLFYLMISKFDEKTPEKYDRIFGFGRFVLIILAIIRIVGIISPVVNKEKEEVVIDKNVAPDKFIGMYKGRIQTLKSTNVDINPIFFKGEPICRIDIKNDLNCILYSENDTTEQFLGNVTSINNPVSSVLIPKLGWAICEKNGNFITLRNDSIKNSNYYFNFSKYESK